VKRWLGGFLAVTGLATAASPVGAAGAAGSDAVGGSSLRIAAGATLPLGDLANEDPREGWVGAQGVGFGVEVAVRYALVPELYMRPALAFYRFGKHRDAAFPVQTSSADSTLTGVDWTRDALMGGIRVHLDYIPAPEGSWTPFLTCGLGLAYMRYHDKVRGPATDTFESSDDTLGATVGLGVGALIGRFEVVLAMTLQEPSFSDAGVTTWSTADLTLGFGLPIRL
jgi:hypothetical protein